MKVVPGKTAAESPQVELETTDHLVHAAYGLGGAIAVQGIKFAWDKATDGLGSGNAAAERSPYGASLDDDNE